MPIRPQSLDIRCPQCGWQMVWQPQSDALTSLPPTACPRCGHPELEARPASAVLELWGQLRKWLTPR